MWLFRVRATGWLGKNPSSPATTHDKRHSFRNSGEKGENGVEKTTLSSLQRILPILGSEEGCFCLSNKGKYDVIMWGCLGGAIGEHTLGNLRGSIV